MRYQESSLDRKIRKSFDSNFNFQHLRDISLAGGNIRGLRGARIPFDYPITAIAGKNGAGKSTILSIACCAYHNHRSGFRLPNRKQTYYTFADFFIQHADEFPLEGITITYKIAHNNWKKSKRLPTGIGYGHQSRIKKRGGRWNNYDRRVFRDVVFLGIERIVPHYEKSQSRSYSKSFAFAGADSSGWEQKVRARVGKILGKTYNSLTFATHSKYRLPFVIANDCEYSGFNMGAGENALFEMLAVMYAVSKGALVVIDEIELGLHSEAQKKLIQSLKEICKERNLQIICTTHSKDIFEELPDDGRVFLERINKKTVVNVAATPEFAFSKMGSTQSHELCILAEDYVAKSIIQSFLPHTIRPRLSIEVIGSATSLARQLSANYQRKKVENLVVVFDGDQRVKEKDNVDHAVSMAESNGNGKELKNWIENRIAYLPGDTWPESWILSTCSGSLPELSKIFMIDEDEMQDVIEQGLQAGKHDEFYTLGKLLGLSAEDTLQKFCTVLTQKHLDKFDGLLKFIESKL